MFTIWTPSAEMTKWSLFRNFQKHFLRSLGFFRNFFNLSSYFSLQLLNILRNRVINFRFKKTPQEIITWIEVWWSWWPCFFCPKITKNFWPKHSWTILSVCGRAPCYWKMNFLNFAMFTCFCQNHSFNIFYSNFRFLHYLQRNKRRNFFCLIEHKTS